MRMTSVFSLINFQAIFVWFSSRSAFNLLHIISGDIRCSVVYASDREISVTLCAQTTCLSGMPWLSGDVTRTINLSESPDSIRDSI